MKKKELSPKEKLAEKLKYEIAEELGLLEKVEAVGWKGLTSRESGRIGGILGNRMQAEQRKKKMEEVPDCPCNPE
jgi:small acid-soluble spore protein F (minor alpha/beta-type SASP)